jgi:biopolymer transport protein ExbD
MFRHGIQTIDAKPMSDLNTTPLIDVMLVLLIMFLVAIPVMTHKIPMTLPAGPPMIGEPTRTHRLDITDQGVLFWDGAAISAPELAVRLDAVVADPAAPMLEIAAAPQARYERVNRALATIARSGAQRVGFVGNRDFAGGF